MGKKKVVTTTTTVVTTTTTDEPVKACRILFVLDRSGSMQSIREEAIGGFNRFLSEQKALPGECTFSLMLFDDKIEDPYIDRPIADIPPLDTNTFVPRAMTALYDAVGRMVTRYEMTNVPGTKTILVILTDGEENASREYNKSTVSSKIKRVEDEYGWETLFLGSGFNVDAVANNLNIKSGNRMKFDANMIGQTQQSYAVASASASAYRGFAPVRSMNVDLADTNAVNNMLAESQKAIDETVAKMKKDPAAT